LPLNGHPPPYHPTRLAITITSSIFNNRLVFIGDNYIRSRTAIYASKMNDVTCEYNLLELNRQTYSYLGYESYGIRLESCFAPKLYINTVRKYNSTTWSNRLTGFSLNASTNAKMECNNLEYLKRPMYFSGNCLGQEFYNDTIKSSGGGLVFSNAAVSAFGGNTSVSPSTGNVFSGFNSTTLRVEGTLSGIVNYYYKTGDDAKYKPSPVALNIIDVFIPQSTSQIRPTCTDTPPKSDDDELELLATQVETINDSVTDTGAAFDFGAEINFYAQQSLYNQILSDSVDYSEHSQAAEIVGEFMELVSITAIGAETEALQLLQEGEAEAALNIISFMPDSSIYEQNIKYVTTLILNIASDTSYNISHRDSVDLFNLAYTHSLIGGPAVFTARNLMQLVVEEFMNGSTKSLHGENNFITGYTQKLSLTPNPANDKASIIGFCEEDGQYKVELYSLQNQLVFTKITNCQSNFEVNNLSNGLYLYKILNNTKLQGYGKIQILR
jgi:hypothetical protein